MIQTNFNGEKRGESEERDKHRWCEIQPKDIQRERKREKEGEADMHGCTTHKQRERERDQIHTHTKKKDTKKIERRNKCRVKWIKWAKV